MSRFNRLIVGVDLGGSKIRVILSDPRGNIVAREDRDTRARQGPEAVIGRLTQSMRRVLASAAAAPAEILGIGIGAPGACEVETGIITSSPNLPRWHNVPLRDIIQREFGVPTYLDNDATLAALGERYFGAGTGVENLIHVTLGTGIGGGIIIGGRVYRGVGGAAGEIGHMTVDVNGPRCNCGNIGCWETFASGTAVAREAVARIRAGAESIILELAGGDLKKINAETVFIAAQKGDELGRELIRRTGYYLGVGLVNLVNIFNPELILIGGGLSQMGELLLAPAREVVRERAFELAARAVRIEMAQLGVDAGVLGAVALVLEARAR